MNKIFFKLIAVGILAVVVAGSSYEFTRRYYSRPMSAGAPLNYPFSQLWTQSVTPFPELQYPSILNLSQVFTATPSAGIECPDCVTILATGDTLPARVINQKTTSMNNFLWPYEKTADVLRSADVTMINLETPIVADCPIRTGGMVFCGDPKNIEGLKYAGIDVVNFANNHSGNAGKEGVTETEQRLTENGFLVTGIQQPVYQTVKGVKFAYLGYNDVEKYGFIADVDDARMAKEITEARANADVVIVQFHWGEEYRYQPTARQKELAYRSIDLGADLIIGNHPHWIEPIEFYKGKLITYSHGNFVFDQMWSTETRQGVVGKYTFQGKNLVSVEFLPILIENFGQPRFLEGVEKQKILDILKRESEKLVN